MQVSCIQLIFDESDDRETLFRDGMTFLSLPTQCHHPAHVCVFSNERRGSPTASICGWRKDARVTSSEMWFQEGWRAAVAFKMETGFWRSTTAMLMMFLTLR